MDTHLSVVLFSLTVCGDHVINIIQTVHQIATQQELFHLL